MSSPAKLAFPDAPDRVEQQAPTIASHAKHRSGRTNHSEACPQGKALEGEVREEAPQADRTSLAAVAHLIARVTAHVEEARDDPRRSEPGRDSREGQSRDEQSEDDRGIVLHGVGLCPLAAVEGVRLGIFFRHLTREVRVGIREFRRLAQAANHVGGIVRHHERRRGGENDISACARQAAVRPDRVEGRTDLGGEKRQRTRSPRGPARSEPWREARGQLWR